VNPEAPKSTMLEAKIKHDLSYYRLPIRYPIQQFQDWMNIKIDGKFIDHGFRINDGKDSVYLEVTKMSPIRMSIKQGRMHYSLPVSMKGNYYKYILGVRLGHREPIEASLTMRISSAVDIDSNWKIKSDTRLDGIDWVENPKLHLGPLRVPLTKYLENIIAKREVELLEKVDSAVYEHINLHSAIAKVWGDIQKPMAIVKEEPRIWFKIHSQHIYADLSLSDDQDITFDVLVGAYTEIGFDSTALAVSSRLPNIRQKMPDLDTLSIAMKGTVPYDVVNQMLDRQVKDVVFTRYGMDLKIQRARMYGTEEGIAIQLDVSGLANGSIYIIGQPEYLADERKLVVTNLRYDVQTKNQAINTANAAIYEYALEQLSGYLVLFIGDEIRRLPSLISEAIEKGKSAERLDLNVDAIEFRTWDFLVTRNNIQFVLNATAEASIDVEKLKVRNPLRITGDK
jgi:hypothetical protein